MKDYKAIEDYLKTGIRPEPGADLNDLTLVHTIEEIQKLYELVDSDDPFKEDVLVRWVQLCDTTEKARLSYYLAPDDNKARPTLLSRWVQLCVTHTEAKKWFKESPKGTKTNAAFLIRWDQLSLVALRSVTTVEQAKALFDESPDEKGCRSRGAIRAKITDLWPE